MENITPQQALDIIYQAARLVALPAKDHELINRSVNILNSTINPNENVEEKEEKEA